MQNIVNFTIEYLELFIRLRFITSKISNILLYYLLVDEGSLIKVYSFSKNLLLPYAQDAFALRIFLLF